jgi:hypothetical protein
VCEGWTEVRFEWIPGVSGPEITKPDDSNYEGPPVLYVHISCDDYEPDMMEAGPDGYYSLTRMVPPGKLKYYFSVMGGDEMTDNSKPLVLSHTSNRLFSPKDPPAKALPAPTES